MCSSCTDEEEAQYQLDVDLSTLTFTHHPLFSKEHVLASRLHQHYKQYTERRRKALSFHYSDKVLWISCVLHVSCILNQYMYINCHWMFIHTIVLMVQCQLPKGLMEAHLILFCIQLQFWFSSSTQYAYIWMNEYFTPETCLQWECVLFIFQW